MKKLTPQERQLLECRSVRNKIGVPCDCQLLPVGALNAITTLVQEGYIVWLDRAALDYNGHALLCDVYLLTPKGVALCEQEGIQQH